MQVIQSLGIWIGKNKNFHENLNWESKVSIITKILSFWKLRNLTIHGKVSVFKEDRRQPLKRNKAVVMNIVQSLT